MLNQTNNQYCSNRKSYYLLAMRYTTGTCSNTVLTLIDAFTTIRKRNFLSILLLVTYENEYLEHESNQRSTFVPFD